MAWWCNGRASDSRSNGHEFNSWLWCYQVTTLGKVVHNLVPLLSCSKNWNWQKLGSKQKTVWHTGHVYVVLQHQLVSGSDWIGDQRSSNRHWPMDDFTFTNATCRQWWQSRGFKLCSVLLKAQITDILYTSLNNLKKNPQKSIFLNLFDIICLPQPVSKCILPQSECPNTQRDWAFIPDHTEGAQTP